MAGSIAPFFSIRLFFVECPNDALPSTNFSGGRSLEHKSAGATATYLRDVVAIVAHVAKGVQGGEVVCVFSNGGFGGIHGKLLERLGRR